MDENTQEYFFRTLFKVFNEADFKYVILHSWQTLPEIATSDVDMMIAADEKDRLEEVLTRVARLSGWRFVQKLWYDVPWCFYYVAVSPDGMVSVALDFVSDPKGIGEYRIADSKILSHRENNGLLWHLTTEAELAYKLAKRHVKGIFRDEDVAFVHDYFLRSDKGVLRARMNELLPVDVSRRLMSMMEEETDAGAYRKFLLEHSPAFRLFNRRWRICWSFAWFVSQAQRIVDRVLRPTGCIVHGAAKMTFPRFVFRREVRVPRLNWLRRKLALASAKLVRVEGVDGIGYDIGHGMVVCEKRSIRESIYAAKKIM